MHYLFRFFSFLDSMHYLRARIGDRENCSRSEICRTSVLWQPPPESSQSHLKTHGGERKILQERARAWFVVRVPR